MARSIEQAWQERASHQKWWCPSCKAYKAQSQIEVKEVLGDSNPWDDWPYYTLRCVTCGTEVRAPDPNHPQEALLNIIDGSRLEDIKSTLSASQIEGFYLAFSEWQADKMPKAVVENFKQILQSKRIDLLADFLTRSNYLSDWHQ